MKQYKKPALSSSNGNRITAIPALLAGMGLAELAAVGAGYAVGKKVFGDSLPNNDEQASLGLRSVDNF